MKRKRPVLYELLRDHASADYDQVYQREVPDDGEAAPDAPETFEPTAEPAGRWRAGRALRVPVGYVFVMLAVLLAAGFSAYMLGYVRGEGEDRQAADLAAATEAESRLIAAGLMEPGGRDGAIPSGTEDDADGARSGRTGRVGPVESDPRQAGLNYYFLVQTTRDSALRLAAFCRERGLEAYVIGANNRARVFVTPGFRWADRDTDRIRRLRRDMTRVVEAWNEHVGRDELVVPQNPEKFKG